MGLVSHTGILTHGVAWLHLEDDESSTQMLELFSSGEKSDTTTLRVSG